MKRFARVAVVAALSLGILAGCGGAKNAASTDNNTNTSTSTPAGSEPAQAVTLKVGASVTPHAEILKALQPEAEKQGIKIEIIEFTDYVQPNLALAEGDLDANYFQHLPYLTTFAADHKLDLVNAGAIHLEPLGFYSTKIKSLDELKDGATVSIPDDPTNGGRALKLLADQGLIKLKEGVGVEATDKDVVENPKNLKIEMLSAEYLARSLEDVDAAVINTNYYLEAQKNLKVDAAVLARESAEGNPFANIIAVRKGDEERPEIKKLMELLRSETVAKFINETYDGAVIPAF